MQLATSAVAPIERSVIAALLETSATWQAVSPEECDSIHLQAVQLIVRAGMAEARCTCRISSDEAEESIELRLCVLGECEQQDILRAIYVSLPGCWLDKDRRTKLRLNLQLQGYSQFRLNEQGLEAQEDLRTGSSQLVLDFIFKRQFFKHRPRVGSRILVESRDFRARYKGSTAQATASVGDVVVHNHISIDVGELVARRTSAAANKKPVRKQQTGVGAERDKAVRAYLQRRKEDFERLVPLILMGQEGAERELRATFGPAAVGVELGYPRQAVSKTTTYNEQIKPLLGKPPRAPAGWRPRTESSMDGHVASMRRRAGSNPQ